MYTTPSNAKTFVLYLFLIIVVIVGAGLEPKPVYAQEEPPGSIDPIGENIGTATVDQEQSDILDQLSPAAEYTAAENSAAAAVSYPGTAAYDSGWVDIAAGETLTLTHNLGGSVDNYVVDLRFFSYDPSYELQGINQLGYGGNQLISPVPAGYEVDDAVGAYWRSLTTSSVKVHRMENDRSYASKIRLRIWVVAAVDYDSGWVTTTPGSPNNITFSIPDGNAENYLVYLEFKDNGLYIDPSLSHGIHQRYYGGKTLATNEMVGAYWRSLENGSITVYVRLSETLIDQVRVRIWNQPHATYDSGWVSASAGGYLSLDHAVGGNPDDYIVDLEYTDNAGNGINQRCYGGCDLRTPDSTLADTKQGAYWRKLTKDSIQVGRRSDDLFAAQVRIRIWNVWTPTRPDYDSGLQTNSRGTTYVVNHGLGGSEDDYLVDFSFYDSVLKFNQMYFGIKTFGTHAPLGYSENDQAGAYWRSLNNSNLTIYRSGNDATVDQWRVRIWRMPKPDYDSGWVVLADGATNFTHNLIGSPADFLVDLTFKDDDVVVGKNQRYLGGAVTSSNLYYGGFWYAFNTNSSSHMLSVYRFSDDSSADQVRVRIWRVSTPDYQTGYQSYSAGQGDNFTHNLNIDPDYMLVDATAHQSSGDHKIYYGRVDIGTSSEYGTYAENDRAGFYWLSLTSTNVATLRATEDKSATSINLRIWKLPMATFIPFVSK